MRVNVVKHCTQYIHNINNKMEILLLIYLQEKIEELYFLYSIQIILRNV